jgi:hypothetical protein
MISFDIQYSKFLVLQGILPKSHSTVIQALGTSNFISQFSLQLENSYARNFSDHLTKIVKKVRLDRHSLVLESVFQSSASHLVQMKYLQNQIHSLSLKQTSWRISMGAALSSLGHR